RGIGALRLVLARAGQALGLQRLADLLDQRIALGDDLVTEDRNQLGIRRIQRAAQAQAHAAALRIDADDAQDELLALRHDLLRMLDALIGQLGHVDQALDAILDASERTEVGELRDRGLDQLPDLVGARNAAPRLRLGALDRQGDLALVGVDAEDVHVHFLANLEQFAWVADTAPAQLGEVNESVSAPNVDEGAKVADRGDATRADLALLELLDELLLHRVTPLLDGLPLRKDEAIAVPVDFNDLERKAGADQAGHIGLLGRLVSTADLADLGCGHETTHAVEVHQQATLVVIGDLGLD